MAIQVIPRAPALGEIIGQGLGQGAGNVLTHLAEQKLNQLSAKQQAEQQQQMYGPIAKSLGNPQLAALGGENLTKILINQQKQAAEMGDLNSYNQISNILQGAAEGQQYQKTPINPMQQVPQRSIEVNQQPAIENPSRLPGLKPMLGEVVDEGSARKPQRVAMPNFADFMAQQRANGIQISPKREKELGNQYRQLKRDAEEKYKTDLQDWREEQKMMNAEEKEGTGQIKTLREAAQDAETKLNTYKELAGYVKSGQLQTGAGPALLKRFGLEDLALNPASRQFQGAVNKLVLEAAKDLKGNLSDKDILFLQQTMPSLSNTPEGLAKMLNILTLKEHIKILPYEQAKQITSRTKTAPRNISDLAYDRSDKNRKIYGKMIVDLAQGKSLRTRTNNSTGDRQIEYRGSWYGF